MQLVLNATYKDGAFIPDQNLGMDKEGKKFKIFIVEEEKTEIRKEQFFRFVEKYAFSLPEDYKFDREELHER
ncbi:MAG: hypothetical protein GY795_09760 [Desulfobacterales bacterium]|nr:hypothetical protein [Desulfobacterales bacterium]